MADEVIVNQQQDTNVADAQAEIKAQMDFALGGYKTPPPTVQANEQAAAKEDATVVDHNTYLKEQLGFEDWESAKTAIAEYKQLKEKPPTAAEIKFANEQSKKIHEALKGGDLKTVKHYIDMQETLSGIEAKPQDEQLKLFIQLTNPKFDADLVDDEYNELYEISETDYAENPMGLRKARAKAAQRIEADLQKAADFFATYRQKIELPEIQNTQVDEDYVTYKKHKEAATANDAQVKEAYKVFAPKDIKENFEINDETNKIKAQVSFEPDEKSFNEIRQQVADGTFYENYYGQDGSPDRQKFLKDMYYANAANRQKAMTAVYLKGLNAGKLQLVNSAAEGHTAIKKELVVNGDGELSELDKQMNIALGAFMPKNGATARR